MGEAGGLGAWREGGWEVVEAGLAGGEQARRGGWMIYALYPA